jgi:hypothetical protein
MKQKNRWYKVVVSVRTTETEADVVANEINYMLQTGLADTINRNMLTKPIDIVKVEYAEDITYEEPEKVPSHARKVSNDYKMI